MKLKKSLLVFISLILVLAGCAADSSDDAAAITWSQIFSDGFERADTPYVSGSDDSLGTNYRAVGDNGGTIQITSGAVLATTTASAADSSNKYVDCLMQEPSFGMELTGSVTFDDFTISTGE